MKDPSHVTASSASHPSITRTGTPIPWLPLSPPSLVGSSAGIPSSASERWKAALQCVPCLRSIEEGSTWTVYRPPTVIQLSEATGCSVSKLAHAYSDLPVITLNKIASTGDQETPAAELDLNFDGFEYLQLSPTDDSLEMAAKALMARRPVPDAEEIFWERTYWEVLRKAKQQMMEKKERSRNKKRLQREKKAMARVSQSSFMMPSPNVGPAPTSSTINSPSFTTPHSRQGSMGGPFSECVDRSPANLPHQTAAQRTARGLLRRARYNETHNPIQRGFMRSLSLVSQGSATQSSIRCRTHRRHDSITSQNTLTGARGFQYPLSSVASDDGRSATSDSLRTPLLHLIQSCRSRELLATSLELDLSTSCDPTNNGITTHSGLALVEGAKADTPATSEVLPPHNTGDLFTPPCNVARKYQTSGVVAASPILSASIQTSQNRRSSGQPLGNTNSLLCSDTTPPKSRIMHKGCATHALGVAPTPSPNLGLSAPHCVLLSLLENGNGDERSSSSPSPAGLKQKPAEKQPSKTERGGNKCRGGSAPQVLLLQPQPRSLAKMQRRSNGRASSGACSEALDVQPSSRCTTARPSVGSTHAPATGSVSSRPLVGTQGTLPLCASRDNLTEGMPKARSSLTGRSLAAQEVIVRSSKVSVNALPTAADTRAQGNGGKPAVTRVDIKPLPPNANSTQPLPGRHLDGGSASVQAFRCPLTPPRTTAATAAISYTPPHPAVSSSAVRSVTVPRAAAVPALSAPVPKPLQATAAVMLPSITLTPATTASSLSSSVTPRATAPTLPSSRIPTREASVPLRTECTAPAMRAALPTAPEGSPDTTPPTSTSVTNSLFPARKLSFAVAAPSKGVEAPLASRQSTTAVTSLKDARCDETKPPSLVSSTASKADTVPPQVGNDGADKSAAIRSPSTLTAPPVACAGCHSRIVPESGATDASPPSKKKAKHKAPDCCAVL
ncbi:hypothetical protein JKF63_02640 [Porcisia hertigi]|uniref:Uncharacterized protein n=1 Tax=Porcisia hertigi TaxID=2761500 RepID=A0A836I9V4_9TRYP|nr:hypothetical protein JKF63_02640 [Porcisia hertigi]